jgi:hypothetical protein
LAVNRNVGLKPFYTNNGTSQRAEIKKKPEDIIDRNETDYKVKSETSYFLSKDFKELFGKS